MKNFTIISVLQKLSQNFLGLLVVLAKHAAIRRDVQKDYLIVHIQQSKMDIKALAQSPKHHMADLKQNVTVIYKSSTNPIWISKNA